MGFINYDISINPGTPVVDLSISATPSSLTVKIDQLGDCTVKANPSTGTIVGGAIAGGILGLFAGPAGALLGGGAGVGTVYAVGELIQKGIQDGIHDGIKGKEQKIDFGETLGYSMDVAGVKVSLTLQSLNLSTFNGMLLATGDVKVD
jgi:hypothetical protein